MAVEIDHDRVLWSAPAGERAGRPTPPFGFDQVQASVDADLACGGQAPACLIRTSAGT